MYLKIKKPSLNEKIRLGFFIKMVLWVHVAWKLDCHSSKTRVRIPLEPQKFKKRIKNNKIPSWSSWLGCLPVTQEIVSSSLIGGAKKNDSWCFDYDSTCRCVKAIKGLFHMRNFKDDEILRLYPDILFSF